MVKRDTLEIMIPSTNSLAIPFRNFTRNASRQRCRSIINGLKPSGMTFLRGQQVPQVLNLQLRLGFLQSEFRQAHLFVAGRDNSRAAALKSA